MGNLRRLIVLRADTYGLMERLDDLCTAARAERSANAKRLFRIRHMAELRWLRRCDAVTAHNESVVKAIRAVMANRAR